MKEDLKEKISDQLLEFIEEETERRVEKGNKEFSELKQKWYELLCDISRLKVESNGQIEHYKSRGMSIHQAQSEYCHEVISDLMESHGIKEDC